MGQKLFFGGAALRVPERPTAAGKYIEAAVYALSAAFFAYVAVIKAAQLASSFQSAVKALAVIALLGVVFWLIFKARRFERASLAAVLLLAAALRVWYVFTVPTEPISDFGLLYSVAQDTANGDVSWTDVTEGYFSWWQYQIPFVLYEALIIKLTHSMAALKLLNVVWGVGTVYFTYRITAHFTSKPCATAAALLLAVYPGAITQSSVLTNQHISLFFILFGVAVLVEARSLWGSIFAGVLLAMANLMRPEGTIIVAAVLCVVVWAFIARPTRRAGASILLTLAAVVGSYFAFQWLTEFVLGALGYAPHGIGNSVPEWKLVVGLDMESGGKYSDTYEYLLGITDPLLRKNEATSIIASHLSAKDGWLDLFKSKIEVFWLWSQSNDFNLAGVNLWNPAFAGMSIEELTYIFVDVEYIMLAMAYVLSAASCIILASAAITGKRTSTSPVPLLTAAILCGTVLAFLIVEIQPRYRYFAMPFVFILAAYTLERVFSSPRYIWKR